MSNKVPNNLSKEKIQQLLSAVGSVPGEQDSQIEATEHNWSEPHCFSGEQLKKIGSFTDTLAAAIAKKFTDFCRRQFEVTIASTKQFFAEDIVKKYSENEQRFFYLPFDSEKGQRLGLLGMPEKTAIAWTKYLLGDAESQENEEKELSQLEKSLLLDLACAIIRMISQSHASLNFSPSNSLADKQWPLETDGAEELFQITFNVKQSETENAAEAFFLLPCKALDVASGRVKKAGPELSKEKITQMITEHIKNISVRVTAQLDVTELSFEDMMELQVDDILLLDKKVSDSIELIVGGRPVCYGWPVQSGGMYAIEISETAF